MMKNEPVVVPLVPTSNVWQKVVSACHNINDTDQGSTQQPRGTAVPELQNDTSSYPTCTKCGDDSTIDASRDRFSFHLTTDPHETGLACSQKYFFSITLLTCVYIGLQCAIEPLLDSRQPTSQSNGRPADQTNNRTTEQPKKRSNATSTRFSAVQQTAKSTTKHQSSPAAYGNFHAVKESSPAHSE